MPWSVRWKCKCRLLDGRSDAVDLQRNMIPSPLLPIGKRSRTMQFWLGWLVVGCIVPAALVAAFLIVQSYQRERASVERNMIGTARALMQAVDADLNGFHSVLQALA